MRKASDSDNIIHFMIVSVANLNSPPATGDSETSFSHPPIPSPVEPSSFPRTSAVMRTSSSASYSRMSALPPPPHPPPQPRHPRWPLEVEAPSSSVQVREEKLRIRRRHQYFCISLDQPLLRILR